MKLKELEIIVSNKLNFPLYNSIDSALNGVQVGDLGSNITKVALMVDASLEGFKQAKKCGADMLFVHHGLFWSRQIPITNSHYNRIKYLIENNLSLT